MRRLSAVLALLALTATLLPGATPPAGAARTGAPVAQGRPTDAAPTPVRPAVPLDPKALLEKMTVAEKVGQLFLVTFPGTDVSPDSDIATLVRDYRVGGVVLLPGNSNYRNAAVPVGTGSSASQGTLNTPQQVLLLSNALQGLAQTAPRPPSPITATGTLTVTAIETAQPLPAGSPTITPTLVITPTQTPRPTRSPTPTATAAPQPAGVPLLIALDWEGNDDSFFGGNGGFSPLASAMAIGATWVPNLSADVGSVVGQELRAVGVNLLLGPTLDVLDVPRPGGSGDLDTRSFGGDPYWVGQMGRAFIRGVQEGSGGTVATAAKHFPGQGASDRRPEDEVATVQKSVEQLRQIELAPFASVTFGEDLHAPGITPALMSSHIRYRGFQGNIRQLTPPISLAPELRDLMNLPEFAPWRNAGGVLISDALGVPAIRRSYDPGLTKFPHRQVAQDAFLAGNDLLYLGRFALTDNWADQYVAVRETIQFFQDKYNSDSAFRARVDASVERLLSLKLALSGGSWAPAPAEAAGAEAIQSLGRQSDVTEGVARSGLSLIYPGRDELADRIPTAPLEDENIVIFTDTRPKQECPTCPAEPQIPAGALQEIILRLYGPGGSGQIAASQVRSYTFANLSEMLSAEPGSQRGIEQDIRAARWIVFAQRDYNPTEAPESAALRRFLAERSDSLRDKRLIVFAFNAPYYLDTTEIIKLTAYFGVYSRTAPFLETAVRALFREFTPIGASPVSIAGLNYELIRQLEPAPGQILTLNPIGPAEVLSGSIKVGSPVVLETGLIVDRNGHQVPDGTPVEFYLSYPLESLALAPKSETTSGGRARTTVLLDRPGELWITAQSGEARNSTRIELRVGGDSPGSIATVLPTATFEPTATATPVPTPTATPSPPPSPTPQVDPAVAAGPPPPKPRVAFPAFIAGLVGAILAGALAYLTRVRLDRHNGYARVESTALRAVTASLWAAIAAWGGYLLYAMGWLPGSTALQASGYTWAAGAITFVAGALSLIWSGREEAG